MQSSVTNIILRPGDAAFGPKRTSSGRWRMVMTRLFPSTNCSMPRAFAEYRPAPGVSLISSEDWHPRVQLRQRDPRRPRATRCLARHQDHAEEREGRGRLGFDVATAWKEGAALPQLRRADGVHRPAVHRSAMPASTSARWICITFTPNADRRNCGIS